MSEQSLSFTRQGISSTNKLILLTFVSVALLMLDGRFAAVKMAKRYIATALYPLQWLSKQPVEWYEYGSAFLQSQTYLLAENQRLTKDNALLKMQMHHSEVQSKELVALKDLLSLKEHGLNVTAAAEVISNGKEPFSSRIIIDKGSYHHVQLGDAVVDENGLVGQVSQVYPLSSEVTILTDGDSVIPVMVARTGVRTLVYGGSNQVELRYFPTDADLQPQDVLVTSGVDSIYPAGIPVAVVTATGKDAGRPYYRASLNPKAALHSSKYVLVLLQKSQPEHMEAIK